MNVLGMGPMEIILIVVLALIVFGPAKLPEIMGQVGKAINDFRKATSETSVGAGESAPRAPSAAAPQTPRPRSTAAKRTARDDLLPPY